MCWGFFLLFLGLGRALDVVVVDAVHRHYKAQLELLGLNARGAGVAIFQVKSTTEASSKLCFYLAFHKNSYEKEVLLDLDVTLSCQEATLPPKPSESLLCETDLKASMTTITYVITMAQEDFRIWKQIHSGYLFNI